MNHASGSMGGAIPAPDIGAVSESPERPGSITQASQRSPCVVVGIAAFLATRDAIVKEGAPVAANRVITVRRGIHSLKTSLNYRLRQDP